MLSEDLENEFCQLWDMSSDKQVARFMLDKGVCDLVLAALVRSTNYRVREVSLGIIANLMCHPASAKVSGRRKVFCLRLWIDRSVFFSVITRYNFIYNCLDFCSLATISCV